MQSWSKKFPVYRAIRVQIGKTPEQTIQNIKLKPVGIFWSYQERAAQCHWGNFNKGTGTVLLEARITNGAVDWESTMEVQLDPSLGDDEKEVRLREGAKLVITRITICGMQPTAVRMPAIA